MSVKISKECHFKRQYNGGKYILFKNARNNQNIKFLCLYFLDWMKQLLTTHKLQNLDEEWNLKFNISINNYGLYLSNKFDYKFKNSNVMDTGIDNQKQSTHTIDENGENIKFMITSETDEI